MACAVRISEVDEEEEVFQYSVKSAEKFTGCHTDGVPFCEIIVTQNDLNWLLLVVLCIVCICIKHL